MNERMNDSIIVFSTAIWCSLGTLDMNKQLLQTDLKLSYEFQLARI